MESKQKQLFIQQYVAAVMADPQVGRFAGQKNNMICVLRNAVDNAEDVWKTLVRHPDAAVRTLYMTDQKEISHHVEADGYRERLRKDPEFGKQLPHELVSAYEQTLSQLIEQA